MSQPIPTQLAEAIDDEITKPELPPPLQSAALFGCSASQGRCLRLLEQGSGTGLVGIAAAALLGARVTVTDLPHVLPNLQFNVDANAGASHANAGAVERGGGKVEVSYSNVLS